MSDNKLICNVTKYCENKLSNQEIEIDPGINKISLPSSEYIELWYIDNFYKSTKFDSQFNIIHINWRRIFSKINEIERLAEMTKAHIITVSENWLEKNIANITRITDFNFEHASKSNDCRGGGVGLFIHNTPDHLPILLSTDLNLTECQ